MHSFLLFCFKAIQKRRFEFKNRKLLIQNPILRSKILKRNEKLFFTEYAVSDKLEIPYLNLQSWNCKFDVVEDYFLEGFEKLITNLRYQNGFLALFVLLEDVENYHIVSVLDHCIADASSVSIIKRKYPVCSIIKMITPSIHTLIIVLF